MTRDEIVSVIARCIGDVLETDAPELTESSRLVDDTGLDSLSSLELLMAVEVAVGITFNPDTLDLGRFPTVGALVDFIDDARAVAA